MKKFLLIIVCILTISVLHSRAQCGAGFIWFPSGTTAPITVNFVDSSFGTQPLTYMWDFGDGNTAAVQNPSHMYTMNGNYQVCLTITDSVGCNNTMCDSLNLVVPPPSVNVYHLFLDSMSFYNCTAPAPVSFYYSADAHGYSPSDSVKFEVSYGDGIDSVWYESMANPSWQGYLTHIYFNAGSYIAQLTVTAPDLITADSASSVNFVVSSTCGSITGTVYNDLNGNCTYDSGEEIPNIVVQIFNSGQFAGSTTSDANGIYSFNVPSGNTYDIHVIPNQGYHGHLAPSCPPNGIITVSSVPSTGNDFGVTCPTGFDLQGSVTNFGFRPGFTSSVCVFAYNSRCNTPPSSTIDIILPSALTPHPDSLGHYTINGQTVTYTIDTTESYWNFCIPVDVSTSANLGDSLCLDMSIQPLAGDADPTNNEGTFCFIVRNSFDPNDKAVSPAGEGPQGLIRPEAVLTYTIRFQNTGNAEAYNIYILDTLSTNLDETSVEIIGTSHEVTMSLLTGNVLRFQYDNIMLADSNSNEPASHGYVKYRIKQKTNLPQLTTITNTAGIYFDFNVPVITNTTVNTVDHTLSVKSVEKQVSLISAYPNPANEKCMLSFSDARERTIHVYDAIGSEVFSAQSKDDSYTIATGKFANGTYNVVISNESGSNDHLKLIVFR